MVGIRSDEVRKGVRDEVIEMMKLEMDGETDHRVELEEVHLVMLIMMLIGIVFHKVMVNRITMVEEMVLITNNAKFL